MLFTAGLLLLATGAAAQSSCTTGVPETEKSAILAAHNNLRSSISSGNYVAKGKQMPAAKTPIHAMTWDCDIEKSAQSVASTCVFAHSTNHNNLGENLYTFLASFQLTFAGQGKAASDSWEKEFQHFGWASTKMSADLLNTGVGQATQMAWASSTKIGCGMALCKGGKQVIVVCQYRDAGNVIGSDIYTPE